MGAGRGIAAGVAGAVAGRSLLRRVLLAKFEHDIARLNAGDYRPLLAAYADDAVLRFNDGEHRWAGEHRGKVAIERFLRDFTAAGLRGELRGLWMGGPPWALTLVARFDDEASAPDGARIYSNRTALIIRTRWGKIVEQEDFYEDSSRITAFDRALRSRGILPVDGPPGT